MNFDEVVQEFREGTQAKLYNAERLQRRVAALGGRRRALPTGEVRFSVLPTIFHHWGQRLGYECWDDDSGFVREFLRDNPECRVTSSTEKIQVGHGSLDKPVGFFRKPILGTKFRKVYGKKA